MEWEPVEGEEGRFLVQSESAEGEVHMVDLKENHGNGQCSCTDFTARCLPMYKKLGVVITNGRFRTRCKHIREIINHLEQ